MRTFDHAATLASRAAGSPSAFLLACLVVVSWAALGPVFHYSDTWQLVINTGTTIVTFLMVFLVQASQNRDAVALHAKLDELIRVNRQARDQLIGVEKLSAEEIAQAVEGPLDAVITKAQKRRGRRA